MGFNWKKEEIEVKISRLLDSIINLAMVDEVITPDEESIIEVCRSKLWGLEHEFLAMTEKNLDVDSARVRIKELFEEVIKSAVDKAKSDGTITSDELILIDRVTKFLRSTNLEEFIHD
ncbi:MAG: hypothetical protein OEZ01_10165 [Candidatus Heimdallarchaeota archaeon]|nr:hypothetical protein [Candidatus Heimdallarchaeota archaeon]MDH5646363.1 hypothetical protein [Candidatus Heimdallarchaeota archaeon]